MYQSDIANAANVACNLAACVRDVLDTAAFTIDREAVSIVFHDDSDALLVEAILELMNDNNGDALKILKSTINRESKNLECFGAIVETVAQKNGKQRDKVTAKGFGLSFKQTDNGMVWTLSAPKGETEAEPENILVETAKQIANGELSETQLAQLAMLLADAAATL